MTTPTDEVNKGVNLFCAWNISYVQNIFAISRDEKSTSLLNGYFGCHKFG